MSLYEFSFSPPSWSGRKPPMVARCFSIRRCEPLRRHSPPSLGPLGARLAMPWYNSKRSARRGFWSMSCRRQDCGSFTSLTRPLARGLNVGATGLGVDGKSDVNTIKRRNEVVCSPNICEGLKNARMPEDQVSKTLAHGSGLRPDLPNEVFMASCILQEYAVSVRQQT